MPPLNLLLGPRAQVEGPPPVSLYTLVAPGPDWNGTPSSAPWTQDTIVTGAPSAGANFSVHETIFNNERVFVIAPRVSRKLGRVTKVEVGAGSKITEIVTRAYYQLPDPITGKMEACFGFVFKPDCATALSINTGQEDFYFKVTTDVIDFVPLVIGPYRMEFRATEYDTLIKVAMTPGFSGATSGYAASDCIKRALDYAVTNSSQLVHIELIEDTAYDWTPITAANTQFLHKPVVKKAADRTSTIGTGARQQSLNWKIGTVECRGLDFVINWMTWNLTWAMYIPNLYHMTFRNCKIRGGAPDTAHNQTGSGASLLYYGRRPNGAWFGRDANNTQAKLEMIGCDLTDLPEYAFASTQLAFNCTLDTMSGTASEDTRGYFGWNSVTNLSSVDADWRTFKRAISGITAPANSYIEKVGLNGAPGFLNAYNDDTSFVAEIVNGVMNVTNAAGLNGTVLGVGTHLKGAGINSGVKIASLGTGAGGTGTYVLNTSTLFNLSSRTFYPAKFSMALTHATPTNTQVATVATTIATTWTGWTAVNDPTQTRDATFLTINGQAPGFGFGPTAIGAGLELFTIIDAHTNFEAMVISALPVTGGVQTEEATPSFKNVVIEFNVVPRVITSGSFSTGDGGRKFHGISFCNNILYDASLEEEAVVQQGRFGGINEYCVFEDNTFINVGVQFLSSYVARGGYDSVSGNIMKLLSVAGGNTTSLIFKDNLTHTSASFPSGADSSNTNLGEAAALSSFLDDPTNTDIMLRARPLLDGPALKDDGVGYSGALLPLSLATADNPDAWNLPA